MESSKKRLGWFSSLVPRRVVEPREIMRIEAENVRLKEALRWYASHRMDGSKTCKACKTLTVWNLGDDGKRARAVLKEVGVRLEEKQ